MAYSDIDIGAGAADYNNGHSAGFSNIDLTNPANTAGILNVFEIELILESDDVKIGTFSGSGTDYTMRDYESLGNDVPGGSKQVFTGRNCTVSAGDFIGGYIATGAFDANDTGGSGVYYLGEDTFHAGAHTYGLAANWKEAYYATGYNGVPDAPTSVSATDNLADKVTITWTAGVGETDGHRVYRDGGDISGVVIHGTATYNDTTATPGVTYTYTVKAINPAGLSAASTGDSGYRLSDIILEITDILSVQAVLNGVLQLQLIVPAFSATAKLYLTGLSAETSLSPPALSAQAVLNAILQLQLLPPELSVGGILSAAPQLQLAPPEFISSAVLSALIQNQLSVPSLSASTILDILDVLVTTETIIVVTPLAAQALLSAAIQENLVLPVLSAAAVLDWAAVVLQLPMPPFTVDVFLRMLSTTEFSDRDYYITYACVLSGMPDIVLPMASFHGDFRQDAMSSLSVVIPGQEYTEAIAARVPVELTAEEAEAALPPGGFAIVNYDPHKPGANEIYTLDAKPPPPASYQDPSTLGNLSVYMVKKYRNGNHSESLLVSVDLQEVNFTRDAVSKGITLSGYRQRTFTPKTVHVYGAANKSIAGGKISYRCTPAFDIHPGDTVIMEDGTTFVAGVISWAVSPSQESMELAETDA